jgi:hypothetical protein
MVLRSGRVVGTPSSDDRIRLGTRWIYATALMSRCCDVIRCCGEAPPKILGPCPDWYSKRFKIGLKYAARVLNYLSKNCAKSVSFKIYERNMGNVLEMWLSALDTIKRCRDSGIWWDDEVIDKFNWVQETFVRAMWKVIPVGSPLEDYMWSIEEFMSWSCEGDEDCDEEGIAMLYEAADAEERIQRERDAERRLEMRQCMGWGALIPASKA